MCEDIIYVGIDGWGREYGANIEEIIKNKLLWFVLPFSKKIKIQPTDFMVGDFVRQIVDGEDWWLRVIAVRIDRDKQGSIFTVNLLAWTIGGDGGLVGLRGAARNTGMRRKA